MGQFLSSGIQKHIRLYNVMDEMTAIHSSMHSLHYEHVFKFGSGHIELANSKKNYCGDA